jgi:hypothetical protein
LRREPATEDGTDEDCSVEMLECCGRNIIEISAIVSGRRLAGCSGKDVRLFRAAG